MLSTVNIEGQPVEITNGGRKNARAWFTYNREDPCDTSESQTGKRIEYIGLEASLGVIEDVLRECVEADGASAESSGRNVIAVLGFSQGGTFAHALASLAEGTHYFRHIDGVICIGAFAAMYTPTGKSKYSQNSPVDRKLGIKSMHVIGKNDTSVRPQLSNELASFFHDPVMYEHEKGHLVPSNSASCKAIISVLDAL